MVLTLRNLDFLDRVDTFDLTDNLLGERFAFVFTPALDILVSADALEVTLVDLLSGSSASERRDFAEAFDLVGTTLDLTVASDVMDVLN